MARRGTGRGRRSDVLAAIEKADPRRHAELLELRRASPQAYRRAMHRIAEQYALLAPVRGRRVAADEPGTPGRETNPDLRVGAPVAAAVAVEVAAAAAKIIRGVVKEEAEAERLEALEATRLAELAANTESRMSARDRVREGIVAEADADEPVAADEPAAVAEDEKVEKPKKKPAAKKKKP